MRRYDRPVIKYIGSKRTLVPLIVDVAGRLPGVTTVCDLFTGTTRVAQGLKRAGFQVTANDLATYSEVLATCYIAADGAAVDRHAVRAKLDHLAALPGVDGYFTETFCVRSRFFQPHNGRRIDAIRPEIDRVADDPIERAILLTSLMEAADRVDSTTGLQMAYLKRWAPRAHNDLELRVPDLIDGAGRASRHDANAMARTTRGSFDLVYVDPPYNHHSYFSNYHIWETLIRDDAPETYGVACKRTDCRTTKSPYNSKRRAHEAFADLVGAVRAPYLLVSFNDEGHLPAGEIVGLLGQRGDVAAVPVDFKRYVGAQIGIHGPGGDRVGEVGRLRNTEYLFLVGDGAVEIMYEVRAEVTGGTGGVRGQTAFTLPGEVPAVPG